MAIHCRDKCGTTMPDEAAALNAGWWLPITGTFRCGACRRALDAASGLIGHAQQTQDALPPTSRGALSKETASSIVAPTVKG
jgi:hypothetical protein